MLPLLINNRYQIIRKLGEGGFGETFLTEDTHLPSHQLCVVKLLKTYQHNSQIHQIIEERFSREAAILEALGKNSDQIPKLYAYFHENDRFYLVQEFIDGKSLADLFYEGQKFTDEMVIDLLKNILPVLQYIHEYAIIHRDIKPDNIIIRHADQKPILIDFGAVKETVTTILNSQGLTVQSIAIGTPGYMSSEQAAGKPIYSSDLYSLGLTCIYLLTGKTPQFLPLDQHSGELSWREFAPNVNPNLAYIIDRVIAYHPRDRFSSAKEMLALLNAPIDATIAPITPNLYSNNITIQSQPKDLKNSVKNQPKPNIKLPLISNCYQFNLPLSLVILSTILIGGFFLNNQRLKEPITTLNEIEVINNDPDNFTNIRSGKGINFPIVGRVVKGEVFYTIPQTETDWWPVRTKNGEGGYMHKSKIKLPLENNQEKADLITPNPSISLNQKNQFNLPIDDHISWAWLSERLVTDQDLQGKEALYLDLMRNSIFARRGRKFKTPEIQNYFNRQQWYEAKYEPEEFSVDLLSKIERHNVHYIDRYQELHNLRYFKP